MRINVYKLVFRFVMIIKYTYLYPGNVVFSVWVPIGALKCFTDYLNT